MTGNGVCNEKSWCLINPVCSGAACCCSHSRGPSRRRRSPRLDTCKGGPSLSANAARIEAFRQGLRELSYVEGKNIVIEWRSRRRKTRSLSQRSRPTLVRLKVAVIVTSGGAPNPPRQGSNFYDSYCHDERSRSCWLTVSSPAWRALAETSQDCPTFAPELSGKRLEILREVVPKLSRVAVLGVFNRDGATHKLAKRDSYPPQRRSRCSFNS